MSQPESTENQNQTDSSDSKAAQEIILSKQAIRKNVWNFMEKNKLSNFPRPVYGRIPNFKECEKAAQNLMQLEEFVKATNVVVNPDKPQEPVRVLVLEQQKQLYVLVPRLKEGLLKHIPVLEGATKIDLKNAVNRKGLEHNGKTVALTDDLKIDVLIMGSVAVSRDGYRVGKGRGYADLEFSILREMNLIHEDTNVVTVVHDCQVYDTLPESIFQPYDVPVDYIVTPTEIIKVQNRPSRPLGIIWNLLSQRKLNLMPILKFLKEKGEEKGQDTTLKEVDTDVDSYEPRFRVGYRRFKRRRPISNGKSSDMQANDGDAAANQNVRPKRFRKRRDFRMSRAPKLDKKLVENGDANTDENTQQKPIQKLPPIRNSRVHFPLRKNKRQIDFSLMVSNIQRDVRVRDLKNALNERGIKPNDITWRGYKGFCYLHYAKPNMKVVKPETPESPPIVVDNVIEILQKLKIGPDPETNLNVKIMEPISRIETTHVTAV